MRRLARTAALAAMLVPAALAAQTGDAGAPPSADTLYQRAQELVMRGNGTDGRALVDSVLGVTRPGSAEHGEALYWRAALAETAAEAERGYLRLTIEYPLHPRTEQALLRLAQLEQTRGNRMLAVSRLQRAVLDFPESPDRARTQLRMARLYLDEQRLPEGCGALQEARRMAEPTDVELRNEVEYLARGCAGVAVTAAPSAPVAAPPVVAPPAAAAPETTAAPKPAPAPRPASPRPAAPRPAAPAKPATTPKPAATTTPAAPAKPAPAAGSFSVQVAAFDRPAPAEALVKELRAEGLEARIDADEQWHRVRIGHFATRAEAAELAKRLKARGVTGFVTGTGR